MIILKTKLNVALARPDFVPRTRLIEQLNEGLKNQLILISAPAGFGKTSLLSNWIEQLSLPVGWVSLDEDDNDPTSFLCYLIAALQTIDAQIGSIMLDALQSPQPPAPDSVLPFLVSDIAKQPSMMLVFDDYHVIKSPVIHDMLCYLLQHSPPNLHLVLATRSDPPLRLSRLRGRQQLMELRTADLQFSNKEAKSFINQSRHLNLSDQDIHALNNRTEGWITGLLMACLSMQHREDKSQFIQSFTGNNRYVLDYLLEEVLEQQPETIKSFLLKTSILTRLSEKLCQAVAEEADSQQILQEMEQANLFVIPLDDCREWFRYHHLFADLLRQHLSVGNPELLLDLHRRASDWYSENQFPGLAIEHALAAGDNPRAIQLISQYCESIWETAGPTQFTKWINLLPDELICEQPVLLAHNAFTLCFSGQFQAAEEQLSRAENALTQDNPAFTGMAATVRAYYTLYSNNINAAADYATLALERLPDEHHIWRSLALSIYGDVHAFYGHVPPCLEIWAEALQEATLAESMFFRRVVSAKLVFTLKRQGQLKKAARMFNTHIKLATAQNNHGTMAVAGGLYSTWGDVLLEWNRIDDALTNIQCGLDLCEQQGYTAGVAWSLIALAKVRFAQCDYGAAAQTLGQLEQKIIEKTMPEWSTNWLAAWQAYLYLADNDWMSAERLLQSRGITSAGYFGYPNEVEYLSLARTLITKATVQSQTIYLAEAEQLLVRLQAHLDEMGWIDLKIRAQILSALAYQAMGQIDQALAELAAALTLAEPDGYLRLFLNEGPAMASLLHKAQQTGISPLYVARILEHFPAAADIAVNPHGQQTSPECLSPREMDVLYQIASGATNREIAQALHIAPGTVKNHLKSIYSKLDAHNRTQAATMARNLGLID